MGDGLTGNGMLRRCDFSFFGCNAECLSLFGRNPQPSRTLCPSFFNSSRPCLPSLFLSTTIPLSPEHSQLFLP